MESKTVVFKFDGPNVCTEALGKDLIPLLGYVYQLVESCSDVPPGVTCIENNCITIKLVCVATAMFVSSDQSSVRDVVRYNAAVKAINTCLRTHGATLDYFEPQFGVIKHFSREEGIPVAVESHHVLRGMIRVYGELLDVGGASPNAHILSNSFDDPVKLTVDRETAKKLAKRLYDQIGVDADVVIEDGKVLSGRILSVIDYEPQTIDEWIKANDGNLGIEGFRNLDMEEFIAEQRI